MVQVLHCREQCSRSIGCLSAGVSAREELWPFPENMPNCQRAPHIRPDAWQRWAMAAVGISIIRASTAIPLDDLLTSSQRVITRLKLLNCVTSQQQLGMLAGGNGESCHPELRLRQPVKHQLLQPERGITAGKGCEDLSKGSGEIRKLGAEEPEFLVRAECRGIRYHAPKGQGIPNSVQASFGNMQGAKHDIAPHDAT